MNDLRGLFAELEPPPGGPERFARRLNESAQPAHSRRLLVAAIGSAFAAVAAAITVLLVRDAPHPTEPSEAAVSIYDAPQFDRLLGRPPRPTELTVMVDDQPASVAEIETTNEKIRIYRVN